MKTKTTTKNMLLYLLIVLCIVLLGLMMCACTDQEKEQAVQNYGESKAFLKKNNIEKHLADNSTVAFYISTDVSGEYRTISEYAVAKANTLTSRITVKIGSSSGNFKFEKANLIEGHTSANAVTFSNSTAAAVITSARIVYSYTNLNEKNLAYKKHTALHEMGHVFGLGHIEADVMKGYTVMIAPHPNEAKYQIDDFTEFDRYNINWKYGA